MWRFLIKEVMSFLISQRDILIIHCGCLYNFILSDQSFDRQYNYNFDKEKEKMTRISKAFQNKKAFIAFVTGGDPDIETTEALIPKMAAAGADLIEIGIPFSDPIAEGVVIQAADERALKAGVTTDKLFDMVKRVRGTVDVPLVFMTYMNPCLYTYGTDRFVKRCAECGIDGIIVPDVPFEEKEEISGACVASGIELISA